MDFFCTKKWPVGSFWDQEVAKGVILAWIPMMYFSLEHSTHNKRPCVKEPFCEVEQQFFLSAGN